MFWVKNSSDAIPCVMFIQYFVLIILHKLQLNYIVRATCSYISDVLS